MVIDTMDYKAEYEKALLEDSLSVITEKTRTRLLTFSSILLVVGVYSLKVKSLPGLSLDMPANSAVALEGILALTVIYLLIKFAIGFLQDYLRWNLKKSKAALGHSGKVLEDLEKRVQELEGKFSSLEPHIDDQFKLKIENLFRQLNGRASDIRSVKRSHYGLSMLHFFRFWMFEVFAPVAISIICLWLTWSSVGAFLCDVWTAL